MPHEGDELSHEGFDTGIGSDDEDSGHSSVRGRTLRAYQAAATFDP